jgi:hypothetical protein
MQFRTGPIRFALLFALTTICTIWMRNAPAPAQTCPTEDPAIDNAKSKKLSLYFPTAADSTFPNYGRSALRSRSTSWDSAQVLARRRN